MAAEWGILTPEGVSWQPVTPPWTSCLQAQPPLHGSRGTQGCHQTNAGSCMAPGMRVGGRDAVGLSTSSGRALQGSGAGCQPGSLHRDLALKGMGMQRNCHGVLSLLHTLVTELSVRGTVLKTVPVCFCPCSLSPRHHSLSILACPAAGMLEGSWLF